jgi:hypothetical protein
MSICKSPRSRFRLMDWKFILGTGSWRMNWFYWTWCWCYAYDTMFVIVEVGINFKSIWCKPNIHNNEVFPENYNIYCKDRIDKEGGGVLLATKKDFISDEVNNMHVDGCWCYAYDTMFVIVEVGINFKSIWCANTMQF